MSKKQMRSSWQKYDGMRPSNHKIQSWLQQAQSIQMTQRMLLNGGSRMFEGSKLKGRGVKTLRKPSQCNLLEINYQSKVFKISQNNDTNTSPKTFSPHRKQKHSRTNPIIYSQGTSPRQKRQNQPLGMSSTCYPRETFKLNTKQLYFKMRRIVRVKSVSEMKDKQTRKDKIEKVIGQTCEYNQVEAGKNGQECTLRLHHMDSTTASFRINSSVHHSVLRTSPSLPNKQQSILLNKQSLISTTRLSPKTNSSFNPIGHQNSSQNLVQNGNLTSTVSMKSFFNHSTKKQKLDPRVQLQLHIAQKLYCMNSKKYHKEKSTACKQLRNKLIVDKVRVN